MKLSPLLAALVVVSIPTLAFADSTTVVVPVGDWVSAIVPTVESILGVVLTIVLTWALRFVPSYLQGIITQQQIAQAEQLLANAIGYGINTVVGAEKGKTLQINVGNAVAAQGVQYALDHGPTWLIDWLGGTEAIQQKIIARLPRVSGAVPAAIPITAAALVPAAP